MKQENQQRWGAYISEFSRQNRMRPTRLGKIKAADPIKDCWLEDSLPLAGIDLDAKGGCGAPALEIMLGGEGEAEGNMTHSVAGAQRIRLQLTADGEDDGLEIDDAEGMTTILRFEPL